MHESDMVKWMKNHAVKNNNKEYLMSKDEYQRINEIMQVIQDNQTDGFNF